MRINILHLSDFHYKEDHDTDFRDAVAGLCDTLAALSVDIVVFSGDLVNAVRSESSLKEAYSVLLNNILDTLRIGKDRLLIVPGNHDFETKRELDIVTEKLQKIDSVKALDDYCSDERQMALSVEKFEKYNQVMVEFFGKDKVLSKDGLYSTGECEVNGKRVKLIGLNSAWRSTLDSKADRGKLLFPISILNDAVHDTDEFDLVLCAMHHQPQDFKEFIASDFEDTIARHCHVVFSGHYHKFKVEEIDDEYSGYIHCVAPATFNRYDKESNYGICMISLDPETGEMEIKPYIKSGESFIPQRTIEKKLPLSEKKRKAAELNKTLKDIHRTAINRADNLFLTGHVFDPNSGMSFKSMFVEPIIRDRSWQDAMLDGKKGQRINIESIVSGSDDIVFLGLNKCGKTSFLFKVFLDTMDNLKSLKTIPYYINSKELSRGEDSKIDLEQLLARELHLSRRDTSDLFKETRLLLLLDDFNASDSCFVSSIKSEVRKFSNIRILVTAEETLSGSFDSELFEGRTLTKLYFHTITSNEIHQLTLRWPGLDAKQKKVAEEKLAQIFRQMHIPFNYWTASLFLWILKKTSPDSVHNNFDLVQYYVSELLDQQGIVEGRQLNVQYSDFRAYLGELAAHLLKCPGYCSSYDELVAWTNEYRDRVLKYTESAEKTINWLIDHTVLVDYSDKLSFRLKGVFEYFIALNMSRDEDFKNQIMSDEHYYLSFGNEIELLAGFRPDDEKLVDEVFDRTKSIFSSLTKDEYYSNVDSRLVSKKIIIPGHTEALNELNKLLISSPTEDIVESLTPVTSGVPIDASKVVEKRWYESIEPTVDNLEQSLFILSRVFRNSNVCNDSHKSDSILDFILLATCNLGILYADELTKTTNTEEEAKLVRTVSRLMPLVMEAFLYDALCQNNLGRVLDKKLNEMIKTPQEKEFMIFLVAFMLLDLNVETYASALEIIDKYIKKGILRYSAYSKLCIVVLNHVGTPVSITKVKQLLFRISDEIKDKSRNQLENMIQQEKNGKKLQKQTNMKDYDE